MFWIQAQFQKIIFIMFHLSLNEHFKKKENNRYSSRTNLFNACFLKTLECSSDKSLADRTVNATVRNEEIDCEKALLSVAWESIEFEDLSRRKSATYPYGLLLTSRLERRAD